MANGLLLGLTEGWMPDASLALVGEVGGLDTNTDDRLSFVDVAGFPGGVGLEHDSATPGGSPFIQTAASELLEDIGGTDFLVVSWMQITADAVSSPGFNIGENNNNGINWGAGMPGLYPLSAYMPWADGSYDPYVESDAPLLEAGTPSMQAVWYTTADDTLHVSLNNGDVFTLVNAKGIGAADPTNYLGVYFGNAGGRVQVGLNALWQGAEGVANAVSQLALLYSGLPIDEWDDGGGEESVSKMEVINQTAFDGLASGASLKASCSISASKTSGALASAQNPTGAAVIATLTRVHVKTGSSAACTADVGTASTLVTNDGLLDGLSVNAAANTVYDNITDHGTNGRTRQYVPAGGYFTAFVASGDANGLVADFYWNYQTLTGGTVFTPGSL